VGFARQPRAPVRLGVQSPYRGAAIDGRDVGVDIDALERVAPQAREALHAGAETP
jgi:hypothetical protein